MKEEESEDAEECESVRKLHLGEGVMLGASHIWAGPVVVSVGLVDQLTAEVTWGSRNIFHSWILVHLVPTVLYNTRS